MDKTQSKEKQDKLKLKSHLLCIDQSKTARILGQNLLSDFIYTADKIFFSALCTGQTMIRS